MARPAKSAKVLTESSQTKAEISARIEVEDKLRGSDNNIEPPDYLNTKQRKIFRYIVRQLKESGILGNLDIYILCTCAIAIDRLQEIESLINKDIENLKDSKIMSAKEKYTKDLYRTANELSLSPQSRAKLSNINLQAKQDAIDPLLQVLQGGNNG